MEIKVLLLYETDPSLIPDTMCGSQGIAMFDSCAH